MKANTEKKKKWLKTKLTTPADYVAPDIVEDNALILGGSYVENNLIVLSRASIIFDTKIYLTTIPEEDKLWSCLITNLGAENQADVLFTKSDNFPKNEETLYEEVTDENGNVFIKFPTYYRKTIVRVTSQNTDFLTGYEIANYKKSDDFEPYDCFLDEDGKILPYVLIGKYQISSRDVANSVESVGYVQQKSAVFREHARAVGAGYQLFDYAMYVFLRELTLAFVGKFENKGYQTWLGVKWWNTGTYTYLDGIAFDRGGTDYCNKPSKYVDSPDMGGLDKPEGYVRVFNLWVGGNSNYIGTVVYLNVDKQGKCKQVSVPSVTFNIGYNKYFGRGWVGANTGGFRPIVANCQSGGYLFFMATVNDGFEANYQARLAYRPIN